MNEMSVKQLKEIVMRLEQRVAFLERENNRRRSEINQVSSAVRKG